MQELLQSTNRTLRTFRYGEIVEGTVISAGRKEVFVDLGSKSEGIIGGREIEEETDSISELKVGDKVLAAVIQTENDQGYTILSLKKAQNERAWREVEEALREGTPLEVKVFDFNKGGLVVELAIGLRGFVPFSHLGSNYLGGNAQNSVKDLLGRTLKVRVIELNREINRLVFSEKLATLFANPQVKAFLETLKPDKKFKGRVTATSPFGVFVELFPGVEGLVHISEISWERVGYPEEVLKVGDKVEVAVLSIDYERGQLALSMRALQKNPWQKVAQKYKVGDEVSGTVTKIAPFGAFLKLPKGVEGLIHVSETTGPLAEGEEVRAVIINLEPEKQKLGLSVKKLKAENRKRKTDLEDRRQKAER